jgi:hypothetical protein
MGRRGLKDKIIKLENGTTITLRDYGDGPFKGLPESILTKIDEYLESEMENA